ncbi:unnamed protein product [Rotaria magnacalcarata]|uniref:Uncharacterized protein n=2 Tax=Rotaria magnacalcarata TaxID=392030 RepID=A0A816KQG5_9BILA|nr:unnamed protein product [Rotaria magnacalcarata]CAF1921267.1 unnamed protein product [Rotaria magnacalcarata]CAF5062727.1 unnamed protein product [Rotaria magnacalcarata]CAF5178009.1 unnamed protein product [Rotaria magnacalcarata]
MNIPSYSPSENVQSAGCSTSSTPPIVMLTVNDYLDGLHFLHEAQKVNATTEETIFKLRLYLEDKVGGQQILNTILTLIKREKVVDFSNNKEFDYCTSLLPLFMVFICLETSFIEQI